MDQREYMKILRDAYFPILEEQLTEKEFEKLEFFGAVDNVIKQCSRIFSRRKRNKSKKNFVHRFTRIFMDKEDFESFKIKNSCTMKYEFFEIKPIEGLKLTVYVCFGTN